MNALSPFIFDGLISNILHSTFPSSYSMILPIIQYTNSWHSSLFLHLFCVRISSLLPLFSRVSTKGIIRSILPPSGCKGSVFFCLDVLRFYCIRVNEENLRCFRRRVLNLQTPQNVLDHCLYQLSIIYFDCFSINHLHHLLSFYTHCLHYHLCKN